MGNRRVLGRGLTNGLFVHNVSVLDPTQTFCSCLLFFSLLFLLQGNPCFLDRFPLLSQELWGLEERKISLLFWWSSWPFFQTSKEKKIRVGALTIDFSAKHVSVVSANAQTLGAFALKDPPMLESPSTDRTKIAMAAMASQPQSLVIFEPQPNSQGISAARGKFDKFHRKNP